MSLTTERKAELFDYLAARANEIKMILDFGGSDWVYMDGNRTPERLAAKLETCMEYEKGDDEDEEE